MDKLVESYTYIISKKNITNYLKLAQPYIFEYFLPKKYIINYFVLKTRIAYTILFN